MNFHLWGSRPLVLCWGTLSCPAAREAGGSWGDAEDPWEGTDVPTSHPQLREAVEEFAEAALFLPLGTSVQFSFSPDFVLKALPCLDSPSFSRLLYFLP